MGDVGGQAKPINRKQGPKKTDFYKDPWPHIFLGNKTAKKSVGAKKPGIFPGENYLTLSYLQQIAVPQNLRLGMKKADLWMRFKECPYWLDVGSRQKSKENLVPVIRTTHGAGVLYAKRPLEKGQKYTDLINRPVRTDEELFPEVYDLTSLKHRFVDNATRVANSDVLCEVNCTCIPELLQCSCVLALVCAGYLLIVLIECRME